MPRGTRYTPEQIINRLREAEVELLKGCTTSPAAKKIGVAEHTFYRWLKKYGGVRTNQAKCLKALGKKRPSDTAFSGYGTGQSDSKRSHVGKLLSPPTRRQTVDHTREALGVGTSGLSYIWPTSVHAALRESSSD